MYSYSRYVIKTKAGRYVDSAYKNTTTDNPQLAVVFYSKETALLRLCELERQACIGQQYRIVLRKPCRSVKTTYATKPPALPSPTPYKTAVAKVEPEYEPNAARYELKSVLIKCRSHDGTQGVELAIPANLAPRLIEDLQTCILAAKIKASMQRMGVQ